MSVSLHPKSPEELQALQRSLRREILTMAHRSKSGHLGSALSVVDILLCVYFGHLRYDPQDVRAVDRDRCILSKGHACAAFYVVLAEAGFFPKKELETYLRDGSRLAGHPHLFSPPGTEASTGSLGHGLGLGTGMALAARLDGRDSRTVVVVSDGECDEGSLWEAALAAGSWKLSSLTCIVDCNKIQAFGRTADVLNLEPFADKWRAFGWRVLEVDGHDCAALQSALAEARQPWDRPTVIIADTIKGKGVSFMEDTIDWHYWSSNDEHFAKAMEELAGDAPLKQSIHHTAR